MARDVTTVLNELIETCKDGEAGFRQAAEDARDPELKAMFARRATDCANGALDLQGQVRRMGTQPEDSGTAAGALHRGWVGLKSALTGRTDLAILEECERGEDVAKARYQSALDEPLPPALLSLISSQYEGVIRNHDQVRELRDQLRADA